ncbi:GNAT family N-acetyltransferase [Paenibacillus sp. LHD-117]|uniref:GNAT family N-acetyltransferase n=1 Tax=Paenibacillus sp. LHD-117 TaxID=3071412 RepID=UPI0027E09AD2|nr:GNAT family N-acetyltransferase [Paenibacillus sp. LHD-117]MDQ6420373.1 GNAT family N-acetyltransferase [Paenibacillus sp. LHD-117]
MIRARKPQDDPELVRLVRTELIPYSHTARPLDAHTIREMPHRFRWGVTYVATRTKQGPALAFVHFIAVNGHLLIDMLATHPEHRGFGYGSTLMAYAEAYGLAHRCNWVRLYVDLSNGRAQRFYQKLGYVAVRYSPELQCYEMAKPLVPLSNSPSD